MNRLLQSIGSSRVGSDQFTAYMLRPSNGSSTTSSHETSTADSLSCPHGRDLNSDPVSTNASVSSESRENLNLNSTSSSEREPSAFTSTETDSEDSRNEDYRGVFSVFRARDSNSWNFQVTGDENSSSSESMEPDAATNSVMLESDSAGASSSVSLSLSAGDTDMYSATETVTLPEPSGGVEDALPFSSRYLSSDSDGAVSNADGTSQEASDRVVGVGRVINVGPSSSRTSYLSHGSNHSSSFATLAGVQGSGTAVATATARTFRHVHTAVVVADGTNGGPQFALRTAINRAIAGAFAGCGEGAVASNIINTTHRLQWWDFSQVKLPDLKDSKWNYRIYLISRA